MYKILVVEDEALIRKGIVYGIDYNKLGCIICGEAKDGEEAVEKILELKPDIVITDITMPVMDAFEMLEATKDLVYQTIILSGYDKFENAQKAIRFNVVEFLVKPIDYGELAQAILKAIEECNFLKAAKKNIATNQMIEESNLVEIDTNSISEITQEIIQFVEKNYQNKIYLEELENYTGYSKTYLQNKFKSDVGYTMNEYMNRYRIQQSLAFISQGLKVYEAAEKCGFSDYRYFNTVFKKFVGTSAKAFAQKINTTNF